jgi:hypothetical protein
MPEFLVVLEESYTRKTHATVKAPDYVAAVEHAREVITVDAENAVEPYDLFTQYGLEETGPMRVLSVVELGADEYTKRALEDLDA